LVQNVLFEWFGKMKQILIRSWNLRLSGTQP
jgi:hypothetical protein